MKARTPLILAIVLLVLAGFYYIYDIKMAGDKEKKKKEEDRIFSFEEKDLVAITIIEGKPKLELQKIDGVWRITSPDKALASSDTLDNFVRELSELKKEGTIEEKPSDLAPFGLKPPKYEIKLKTSLAKEYSLLVGDKNPSGTLYYAQIPGKTAVITISSLISSNFERPPKEFWEKDALSIEPEKVTKLMIKYKDGEIGLETPRNFWTQFRKDQEWRITKPVQVKGDRSKINSLLWDIKAIKAERFLEGKERETLEAGLKNPAIEVTIEEADRKPETLIIGQLHNDKKNHICMRKNSGEAFLVKSDDIKKLYRKYDSLEDTHIVTFEPKDVNEYEIKTRDMTIVAQRSKEEWKLIKPEKVKKSVPSLEPLIWRIENSSYQEKKKMEGVSLEFVKNPYVSVTLIDKNKAKLFTLLFGEYPGDRKKFYVMVEPSKTGEYYVVDDSVVGLAKTIQDEIKAAQEKPSPSPSKQGDASQTPTVQASQSPTVRASSSPTIQASPNPSK